MICFPNLTTPQSGRRRRTISVFLFRSLYVYSTCQFFSVASVDTFWILGHQITKHDMDGSLSLGYRKFRAFLGHPHWCVLLFGTFY